MTTIEETTMFFDYLLLTIPAVAAVALLAYSIHKGRSTTLRIGDFVFKSEPRDRR